MASSTGIVLMIGGITVFNDVILNAQPFNWKVPIATGIAALLFDGLEHISPELAIGMAWVGLVAVTLTRVNPKVPAPAESLMNVINGKAAT